MEKPNARGPTPSRKAHLALGEKLNRKEKIARSPAAKSAARSANIMHEHLPALAAKIRTALSTRPEYFVTQPVELRILRGMSEAEIKDFAASHGWRVVPRLGGRQVEFYNDASRRVEL